MIWIPVLCMSVTLRTSESQAMMLILAAVMAVLITVSIHWSLGDVEGWWREMVLGWIGTEKQTKEAVDLREAMLGIVPFMNAFMMGCSNSQYDYQCVGSALVASTDVFSRCFQKGIFGNSIAFRPANGIGYCLAVESDRWLKLAITGKRYCCDHHSGL